MLTPTSPIRVLLADDHESVRQGLCALFGAADEVDLISDVNDGASAITMAKSLAPDVVILDLSMPTSGLVALQQIKNDRPETQIVVLSRHRDAAYLRAALAAGASGYVLKQSSFDELKRAVVAVANGEQYLDAQLISEPATLRDGAPVPALSQREAEVLRRAAAGFSNKEIGAELKISVKTVEAHKANAMRKLRLKDRSAVVRFALMQGWLEA
jgi:two-component system response regulator NreC